jgi:hypothetical protein
MLSLKIDRWCWSGARIMMRSAHSAASATDLTSKPSSWAFSVDFEPSLRAMTTSTPESRRFWACAWPCEP